MADRRHDDNAQGRVKDPANDARLKENRDGGGRMGASMGSDDDDRQSGGQGRVKDPAHDGRLKDNR